jgi:hypothetical protein
VNDTPREIHPLWRAVIGAAFALGIGTVGLATHSFWNAILLLILVIVGAVVGVLVIGGE